MLKKILKKNKIEKLPIINAENKLVGQSLLKILLKIDCVLMHVRISMVRLRVAAAVGVTDDVLDRVSALVKASVDAIIIDTAHGHTKGVVDVLKNLKLAFPELDIVVGNIATAEAAQALIDAGADAVKVDWPWFYLYN